MVSQLPILSSRRLRKTVLIMQDESTRRLVDSYWSAMLNASKDALRLNYMHLLVGPYGKSFTYPASEQSTLESKRP
jgi:hypothetical protein